MRFYLGTHRFTPLAAVYTEMDWLDSKYIRWLEMLRLWNRISDMPDSRWPKKVLNWDQLTGTDSWYSEVKFILKYANVMDEIGTDDTVCLDLVKNNLLQICRKRWAVEACGKSKLRTFIKIHDFSTHRVLLEANLSRRNRSLVTKLKSGVLSLRVETGRFKGSDPALRECLLCTMKEVEDEMHYLYRCPALEPVRKPFMDIMKKEIPSFEHMQEEERTMLLLCKDHIKDTARWFDSMYRFRFEVMNRKI